MPSYYRVWCRHGKLEIEIESTDKAYVDRKVDEFTASLPKADVKATKGKRAKPKGLSKPKKGKKRKAAKKAAPKKSKKAARRKVAKPVPVKPSKKEKKTDLASAIRGAKNFSALKSKILSRSRQLPRVLLCLSFAKEATAADVTAATKKLGSEIIPNNVAKVIRQQGKGLVRAHKAGAVTTYAITAKGKKHIATALKG